MDVGLTKAVASIERRRETMELLKGILDAFRTRNSDLAERLTRAYVERSAAFATAVLRDLNQNDHQWLERQEMEPRE